MFLVGGLSVIQQDYSRTYGHVFMKCLKQVDPVIINNLQINGIINQLFLHTYIHTTKFIERQNLILDRLLTSLMTFSTLVLKPFFSRILSIYPLLRIISWKNLTTRCLAVTSGGSVGECGRGE